tara:strand:- start:33 stop:212 length:180 start_codon:yes stop_codon:yes gene_type:complete
MKNRSTDDRRVKKIKVAVDNRKIRRRQEDKDNIKAYYAVLGLSIAIFIIIGLLSLAKGF